MVKITELSTGRISPLLDWSSLILSSCLLFVVLVANVAERWLVKALWPKTFRRLKTEAGKGNSRQLASFTYHHVSIAIKSILLLFFVFPGIRFYWESGLNMDQSAIAGGSYMKFGELIVVALHLYTTYYVWELCFRGAQASVMNIAHHVGLILIAQSAIARCSFSETYTDANVEMYLCLLWGIFDMVFELPISVAMIAYRVKWKHHLMLHRFILGAATWFMCGIILDIVVTAVLLWQSWAFWDNVWRVVIPLVFSMWVSAQVFGWWQVTCITGTERRKWLADNNAKAGEVDLERVPDARYSSSQDDGKSERK